MLHRVRGTKDKTFQIADSLLANESHHGQTIPNPQFFFSPVDTLQVLP